MAVEFGRTLKRLRRNSADPEYGGFLTQERLAELIGERLGTEGWPYGAVVSNWERSKQRLDPVEDRKVLVVLVGVLAEFGGLRSTEQANKFLKSGGYAPLAEDEKAKTFRPSGEDTWEEPKPVGSVDPAPPQSQANCFMPPLTNDFVGRDNELEQLDGAFKRVNIVSLVGLPGVGKTYLAARYAAKVGNTRHVFWIDQPIVDSKQLAFWLNQFLRELGENSERLYGGFEDEYDDKDVEWNFKIGGLVHLLKIHPCLLIFDNFSGRYQEFEPLLTPVTQRGKNVQVLLVSRSLPAQHYPLKLFNCIKEIVINGLSKNDAHQYICAFREADDLPPLDSNELTELVRKTQGHPLAMNLALFWMAAGVPVWRVIHEIVQLDQKFGSQLKQVYVEILPLLDPVECFCLTRLSVFETSVSKAALDYIEIEQTGVLDRLIQWRLITPVGDDRVQVHAFLREFLHASLSDNQYWHRKAGQFYEDQAVANRAFRLDMFLEAVHQFRLASDQERAIEAANLLAENLFRRDVLPSERLLSLHEWFTGLTPACLSGHPWLMVQVARAADYSRDLARARELLELAIGKFQAAEQPLGTLAAIYYRAKIMTSEKQLEDGLWHFERALDLAVELQNPPAQVRILRKIGDIKNTMGEYNAAKRYGNLALELARRSGDVLGEVLALYFLGNIARKRGYFEVARHAFEQALESLGETAGHRPRLNDPYLESKIFCRFGVTCTYLGRFGEATQYLERSIEIKHGIGDKYGLAIDLDYLGDVECQRGNYAKAEDFYTQSRRYKSALSDEYGLKKTCNNLGLLWLNVGRWSEAAVYLESGAGIPISDEYAQLNGVDGTRLSRCGELKVAQGEFRAAVKLFVAAVRVFRRLGVPHTRAVAMLGLGRAFLGLGYVQPAKRWLGQALEVAKKCQYSLLEAQCRHALAFAVALYGGSEVSDRSLKEAELAVEILERIGARHELLLARETQNVLLYQALERRFPYGSPEESVQPVKHDLDLLRRRLTRRAQEIGNCLESLKEELSQVEADHDAVRVEIQRLLVLTKASVRCRPDQEVESSLRLLAKLLMSSALACKMFKVLLVEFSNRTKALGCLSKDVAVHLAWDGLQIYGPLADVVGSSRLQAAIEDRCFQFLQPVEFDEIQQVIKCRFPHPEAYLAELEKELQDVLPSVGMQAEVVTRFKHIYSIYSKMRRKKIGLDEILDYVGARIIVGTIEECYEAQSVITEKVGSLHDEPFLEKTVRDYIVAPKVSEYQSIHFNVQRRDGRVIEIQIRTRGMHDYVEFGMNGAAHFNYKHGKGYSKKPRKRRKRGS